MWVLDGREQPLVERLVEVAALQVVAQPLEGGVVVEQRAQQRLLGLDAAAVGDARALGGLGLMAKAGMVIRTPRP